jgi:amino acid transporter/nucleotide-binding universal stress UspA family protein
MEELSETRKDEKLGYVEAIAMAAGATIGGGIFAVLGVTVAHAGHAAPVAFLLCGLLALATGHAYGRLAETYRRAGGIFVYLAELYGDTRLAGSVAWYLILGYMLTISLYAYTFGHYTAALFNWGPPGPNVLATSVIAFFVIINLLGVRESGITEDIVTYGKLAILLVFAIAGLMIFDSQNIRPFFNRGLGGVLAGGAVTFVAYEGWQVLAYDIDVLRDPPITVMKRCMMISILTAITIYLLVSFVVVGTMSAQEIVKHEETVLAVAAQPVLGQFGMVLIIIGAACSTSSAINATLFGTARLTQTVADYDELPRFLVGSRDSDIPVVSTLVLGVGATAFAVLGSLEQVATFASIAFLLLFAGVNLVHLRVSARQWYEKAVASLAVAGLLGVTMVLLVFTYQRSLATFFVVVGIFAGTGALRAFYVYERNRRRLAVARGIVEGPTTLVPHRVLIPLLGGEEAQPLVQMAAAVTNQRDGDLLLLSVRGDDSSAPEEVAAVTHQDHVRLAQAAAMANAAGVHAQAVAWAGQPPAEVILDEAKRHGCDLLLLGFPGSDDERRETIRRIALNQPADIALLKAEPGQLDHVQRVLLAVGHESAANITMLARLVLAVAPRAQFDLVHAIPLDCSQADRQATMDRLQEVARGHRLDDRSRFEVLLSDDPVPALIEKSADYDMVLLGLTHQSLLEHFSFGDISMQVAEGAQCPALVGKEAPSRFRRWMRRLAAPPEEIADSATECEAQPVRQDPPA